MDRSVTGWLAVALVAWVAGLGAGCGGRQPVGEGSRRAEARQEVQEAEREAAEELSEAEEEVEEGLEKARKELREILR